MFCDVASVVAVQNMTDKIYMSIISYLRPPIYPLEGVRVLLAVHRYGSDNGVQNSFSHFQ